MSVKISDLLPEAVEVPVGKGSLTINPLDLAAVTKIIQKHKTMIVKLIQTQKGTAPDYAAMVTVAPDLVAEVIAYASGTVGQEKDIKKLPASSQIQALIAIWEVSVPDPKGFMNSLLHAAQNMGQEFKNQAMVELESPTKELP